MKNETATQQVPVKQGQAENSTDTYTHIFKTPFAYMDNDYTSLRFDWASLTGHDSLAIEAELQAIGKPAIVPELSGEYLIRMAAKACTTEIGPDALQQMNLADYNKIRNRARSFLLASGQ